MLHAGHIHSRSERLRRFCNGNDQHQFSDHESTPSFGTYNYSEPTFDKWNHVAVNDGLDGLHRETKSGTSAVGERQTASNRIDPRSTRWRHGDGLNGIPYDLSALKAETVVVDLSTIDRVKPCPKQGETGRKAARLITANKSSP